MASQERLKKRTHKRKPVVRKRTPSSYLSPHEAQARDKLRQDGIELENGPPALHLAPSLGCRPGPGPFSPVSFRCRVVSGRETRLSRQQFLWRNQRRLINDWSLNGSSLLDTSGHFCTLSAHPLTPLDSTLHFLLSSEHCGDVNTHRLDTSQHHVAVPHVSRLLTLTIEEVSSSFSFFPSSWAHGGLPFWRGRCDKQANLNRAEALADSFGIVGAGTSHNVVDGVILGLLLAHMCWSFLHHGLHRQQGSEERMSTIRRKRERTGKKRSRRSWKSRRNRRRRRRQGERTKSKTLRGAWVAQGGLSSRRSHKIRYGAHDGAS